MLVALSDDSDGDSSSSVTLGHLSPDLQQPVMSESSMLPGLLHPLQILSDLRVKSIRGHVHILSALIVSPSVEEPHWNPVALWIGDDLGDLVPSFLADASGSRVQVHLGQFADQVRQAQTDTLDGAQGVGHASTTLEVGVHHSDDVFEFFCSIVDKTLTLIRPTIAAVKQFISFGSF